MSQLRCRSAAEDDDRSHAARSARFCAPLPLGLINLVTHCLLLANFCGSSPRAPTPPLGGSASRIRKRAFRGFQNFLVCLITLWISVSLIAIDLPIARAWLRPYKLTIDGCCRHLEALAERLPALVRRRSVRVAHNRHFWWRAAIRRCWSPPRPAGAGGCSKTHTGTPPRRRVEAERRETREPPPPHRRHRLAAPQVDPPRLLDDNT
jgi:hypothetical protein